MSANHLGVSPTHTPHHTPHHTPRHTSSHLTPTHDVSNYCTLSRKASNQKKATLDRKQSESIDDLYTGTRVSKVPELQEYTVKVCALCFALY